MIRRNLDRFFFHFSAPFSVAAFRIMFGLTLLADVILRLPYTNEYFTDASGIPVNDALLMVPDFFQPIFSWYPRTIEVVWGFQIVMILALVILTLGLVGRVGSRLTAFVILICHQALIQRNYTIIYGADIVASFWIFGLCLMDSTERLSLVSRRTKSLSQNLGGLFGFSIEPEWSRLLSSVGARLLQIQLCVIYMYTGFEKLKGADWWDQTAIWKVLGNEQLMTMDLSFLRAVPLVIGIATWGTVLFEVYSPLLFWSRATRKWVLVTGWLLHIGIALMMGLFVFSFTMMSAYLLFVDPRWLEVKFSDVRLKVSDKALRFDLRS